MLPRLGVTDRARAPPRGEPRGEPRGDTVDALRNRAAAGETIVMFGGSAVVTSNRGGLAERSWFANDRLSFANGEPKTVIF